MLRPQTSRRSSHLARLRPALDLLEGRALMAHAGLRDPSFGGGAGYITGLIQAGSSPITTLLRNVASVATEADGSTLVAVPDTSPGGLTFAVQHQLANGSADTNFGAGGKADVALPSGFAAQGGPTALLVQPNGGIIVAGLLGPAGGGVGMPETVVARFLANGTPDPNFGTNGVEALGQTQFLATGVNQPVVAAQADGSIVLAATGGNNSNVNVSTVLRLTPTGQPDPTFGTNGSVTLPSTSAYEAVDGVAVQPDGRILVLANIASGPFGSFTQFTPALVRLNAGGSVDGTFSGAGLVGSGINFPTNLAVQPDGNILVLGFHDGGLDQGRTPGLARLNPDGSIVSSEPLLGRNAVVTGFALAPNGDVVLSGQLTNPNGLQVFRLTPDLQPDYSFGAGGLASVSPPPAQGGASYVLEGLAISPTNQVVLVAANPFENFQSQFVPPSNFLVARLTGTPTHPTPGDFNGDGISDPALYLTGPGAFAIQDSTGLTAGQIIPFGTPGPGNSIPAPGDYYGTGQDDVAVYLPNAGAFAVQDPTGQTSGQIVSFGTPGFGGSIPAPGDYFGSGRDDFAVYLPAQGAFAIKSPRPGAANRFVPFGSAGTGQSIPVPGDYYGTGRTDVAVYLASAGAFAIQDPTGQTAGKVVPFGLPGLGNSIPMPGDYDGSGKTELAVFVPGQAAFYYRPANGGPDVRISIGVAGPGQTLPMQGDYTGSGKTSLGIYLPSYGTFAYRAADSLAVGPTEAFGTPGYDKSIPVTATVLSPFPGTPMPGPQVFNTVSAESVFPGQPDPLDFLPADLAKKPKAGA